MQRKGNNLKEIETHDSEHSSGPRDIRFYHLCSLSTESPTPTPNSQHPMMPLLPSPSNFWYLMKSSCHKRIISCKILNHKSVGLKGKAHLSHPVTQS